MRILVACEKSHRVAGEFRKLGHDAWSCDILPCEIDTPYHIQGNVIEHLNDGWDMMIAHPPCTFLSWAATRFWNDEGRYQKRAEAIYFFLKFVDAPIARICIENPLGIMSQVYREPDQVIHPYYFGEPEMKRTCLWLKNLPKLEYQLKDDMFAAATATPKPEPMSYDNTPNHHARYFTDGKTRKPELRSKTFLSVARAMAEQWGNN